MRSELTPLIKILLLTWFLAAALYPARLYGQNNGDSEYKERISQAVREFDLGNWQEARALFKQAHQLKPSARTLRGMGMAAFEMRKYLWALHDLQEALKESRQPLTEEQRGQANKLVEQSKSFIGRFRLVVEPSSATVEVDDKPAELESDGVLLLEIGEHQVAARAPEYQELKQSVTVEGGEERELRLTLESVPAAPVVPPVVVPPPASIVPPPAEKVQSSAPPPTPETAAASQTKKTNSPENRSSGPTWAWAALGIGALTGVGAGGFWILGNKQFNDLKEKCDNYKCSVDSAESRKKGIEQLDKLASVFLGISVSFAALSVVLFVVESIGGSEETAAPSKSSGVSATLGIHPSGLQLNGSF
jgi:hypothetical protein